MDLGLKGKVALVMGSSQGLGHAIAAELCKEGAKVVLCARNEKTLADAASKMGAAFSVAADLSKPDEGARAVDEVLRKFGRIDIVVTNTGGPPKGDFQEITAEKWQTGFQGLWMSAVDSIQKALPSMRKNKWGRIIMITSAAAKEPMPHLTVSNGLRAGLIGLAKSLCHEVAVDGVTVNVLLPGYTRTERLLELGIAEDKITGMIPARRLGEPEELAAMTAFLASDRAAYVTGQAIAIDGGYLKSH